MASNRVLVTGANGFIGRVVCAELASRGYWVTGTVRNRPTQEEASNPAIRSVHALDEIDDETDWSSALSGVDCIVHLAARVHVMSDKAPDRLAEYRRVNVALTMNLARQAAKSGVRRFVFISSIKVNGERTLPGEPFTAEDVPRPEDAYAVSKYEAERALMQLAEQSGMEVVIIRPVLVYGPGVKANFRNMVLWLRKNIPLPLGALHNRRSLVAVDNLADFIATCVDHPAAANEIFLISDGEDLSVTDLLRRIAAALGKSPVLLPVPASVLGAIGRLLGKTEAVRRLCESLQVDISKSRRLLGWHPPVSVNDALTKTAEPFLRKQILS